MSKFGVLLMGFALMANCSSMETTYNPNRKIERKKPLTAKQLKERSKSKNAKKQRKKQRS